MDQAESIRMRPSMYIGSTEQFGLQFLVGEVLSNSVDQFAAGHAKEVSLSTIGNDITVTDDGEGLPFEMDDGTAVCQWLTELHDSASANHHAPHVHIHGRGLGLMPVNALSSSMVIRSWRKGELWEVRCSRGRILTRPHVVPGTDTASRRGTTVSFTPDPKIFGETVLNFERVKEVVSTAAYLFPGLCICFPTKTICAPEGLADFVRTSEFGLGSEPVFRFHERVGDIEIQTAVGGQTLSATTWRTWCNGSRTVDDGTHREGLSYALRGVRWRPLVATIHVIMHDPRYAGPTRGILDVPVIRKQISRALREPMHEFASKHRLGKYAV